MGKIYSDRVENIVRKEENAGHKHFVLFQICFQKTSSLGSLQFWIGYLTLYHTIPTFNDPEKDGFCW